METRILPFLTKWPNHVRLLPGQKSILVLSKDGLSGPDLLELQADFIEHCGPDVISIILSLKMMHIYFRMGARTFDYRPHRGVLSGLSISDYHSGRGDRVEVLMRMNGPERVRFQTYQANILRSPSTTLGKSFPLSLREPDFTLRSQLTRGSLEDNRLLNLGERHNCLSWFTTARLGTNGESVIELLRMNDTDIMNEAHSYIVAFYKFLCASPEKDRVPGFVFWTQWPAAEAIDRIRIEPHWLEQFYSGTVSSQPVAQVS